ncbi:MAG: hypothetical protein AAF196_17665 [Planctomycetota bacterium]
MPTKSPKPASSSKTTKRKTRAKKGESKQPPETNLTALEDGDALLNVGAARAARFGRCGGRPLVTELEREVCDRLTGGGVAHSHRPRHFEIKLEDESLAAFAPTIVVRGRGREGKVLVIETLEQANQDTVRKIAAFRALHGAEFFVSVIAPEAVLDEIPFDLADEMLATTELYALIGRLTD